MTVAVLFLKSTFVSFDQGNESSAVTTAGGHPAPQVIPETFIVTACHSSFEEVPLLDFEVSVF